MSDWFVNRLVTVPLEWSGKGKGWCRMNFEFGRRPVDRVRLKHYLRRGKAVQLGDKRYNDFTVTSCGVR